MRETEAEDPEPLLSGVVGTGFIGTVHVEALRRLGRPMLGVVGSSPERTQAAAERMNITAAYASLEEMLDDPQIHVVHVASPNHLHFEHCRKALRAGKHVICEKPLAPTSKETAKLVRLADKAGVVTAVNYNIRYYPLCVEGRQRIRDGQLGPLYHVTGSYLQDWLLYETDFNWRVLPEAGGALRAVADIGTHWLDLVTWMTGLEVESVCADLRTVLPVRQRPRGPVETFQGKLAAPPEGAPPAGNLYVPVAVETEDYASVLLRFRGGVSGCFTVSQVAAGRKNCLRYEIAGGRAALAWDSEHPNDLWIGHRDRANESLMRDPALLAEPARAVTSYPGGHAEGFPDTFKQLFRAVYDYIDKGDPDAPRPFPTFQDGHREALLCEAILGSHREERWVKV